MSKDHQEYDLTANIQDVLNSMHTPGDVGENTEPDEEELETIHVYPVEGGGILFTRTPIEEDLDTAPIVTPQPSQPASNAAIGVWFFGFFVMLSCLMFQCYVLFNPLTVTVTLKAQEQQVTLTGTLQLGRVVSPITVSQSAATNTTGHGHQDAANATGYITFYNGLFRSQTVAAGTILTGNDGVQIITDQIAVIPAATENIPPIYGQVTVAAHAIQTGSSGNIAADDIHQTCCSPSVLAENGTPFHNGQDERNYQTVTQADINNVSTLLKTTLNQSVQGALQGQLKTNESFVTPSCTTTTNSNHQPGEEATQVKVTVSESCSAVAYNQDTLQAKVTQLLTTQATRELGTGYSLLDTPQVNVTQATAQNTKIVLSFKSQSTWIYALGSAEQKNIKKIIAGKNIQRALQVLRSLPGIEHVSMHFTGFGDDTRIPKNLSNIHLLIFYGG